MLEHLLDCIIPIRVLGQLNRITLQLYQKFFPVFLDGCLLEDDLDDTKPASISCQFYETLIDFFKDKLPFWLLKALDDVLDHMGSLGIKRQLGHMTL